MIWKVQWLLRLVGFLTIGASMFISSQSSIVAAVGGVLYLMGMIKIKKKK